MDIGRALVAAVALGVAFVPPTSSEVPSVASFSTLAAPVANSDVHRGPDGKLLREHKDDLPSPFSPGEVNANTVTGSVGELTSGLDGFAGLWVDDTGLVHLAVKQGCSDAIKDLLGDRFKGEVVVVEVKHSYKDLVQRRDSISAQIEGLTKQGLNILEWGPDEVHNTVRISLVDYTEAKAEQARALLGQDVVVEASMATGGTNDLLSVSLQAK